MREVFINMLEFVKTLSIGDYFFFIGTFLLIVLFIYVLYLIKLSDFESDAKKSIITDNFDIASVANAIEKEYKPEAIKLTTYEVEQENNAIISYEELVKNKDKFGIGYDDEYAYELPELNVKKINLTNKINHIEESKLEVKLMQYDKEEAFLKALKELQENLGKIY
ncbi:MAG: hypothetical protein PHD03_04755 [Bacilli bacterium]|nr:hypothetical protein [Bacilli bacterium]MDD4407213.1 hypothetical protein [Bacilli bacterium]